MKTIMKTKLIKIVVLCSICIFEGNGMAQSKKIQQMIENSITYNNITNVHVSNDGTLRIDYEVSGCNIDEEQFNKYQKNNNRYKIFHLEVESRYKFGAYQDYIIGFEFFQLDQETNTLQYAIRLANNEPSLRMPSYQNVKDVSDFYNNYVKRHSKIAAIGKKVLSERLIANLKSSPERIIRYFKEYPYDTELLADVSVWSFLETLEGYPDGIAKLCEASPYENDVFKDVNILTFLEYRRSDRNYVFYKNKSEGYIVNNATSYTGGIRNKQMHGKGKLEWVDVYKNALFAADTRRVKETMEGWFENGRQDGKMKHTWTDKRYLASNGILYKEASDFQFEEEGFMKDGNWNGLVVYKAVYTYRYKKGGLFSSEDIFYREDIFHFRYNDGVLVSKELIRNNLTHYLMENNASSEQFAEFRVPKISNIKQNGNGYDIKYEDGTFISRAYSVENNGTIYCDGWPSNERRLSADEAARFAYLWRKFHNAWELCHIYGIPMWRR